MTSLRIDETGSAIFTYEKSDNYQKDYALMDIMDWTNFDLDEKNSSDSKKIYNLAKSSDKVKFMKSIQEIIEFFEREIGYPDLEKTTEIDSIIEEGNIEFKLYQQAITKGTDIKNSESVSIELGSSFKRLLKDFQEKSVAHILAVNNAANFSVPGSGKTTISYAAISRWLEDEIVDKILVIGPLASFVAWEREYVECFGKPPKSLRVSGDNFNILENIGDNYDLFLISYQSASNKYLEIQKFLTRFKTVLILDESHRIKNPGVGKWVESMKILAPHATRRMILTGTPMPNDYRDLWTQITFLWPQVRPLGNQLTYNQYVLKRGLSEKYRNALFPLFSRVMKDDLHLPPFEFKEHYVPLRKHQREIYDIIEAKTLAEIQSLGEHSKLQPFRRAKMIRLLQTASNPTLLHEHSIDFAVTGKHFHTPGDYNFEDDDSDSPSTILSGEFGFEVDEIDNSDLTNSEVSEKISRYSELEIPIKITETASLAKQLVNQDEKVVIWSTFLLNQYILQDVLNELNPIVINGNVPINPDIPGNREELIHKFLNEPDSKILIGTASSIGESVSLHLNDKKESVSKHAIYLDRNFNGAQFMQSVDRLHRVGMPDDVNVTYHLIIGRNTIDERINDRLKVKWSNMLKALNDDFLEGVNFDAITKSDTELDQDYQELVESIKLSRRNQNGI